MNAAKLEQRLAKVDGTAESINTISAYCRAYESEAESVAGCWLKVLSSAPKEQVLPLLYLANDVLQRSAKTGNAFIEAFSGCLEAAMKEAAAKAPESLAQIKRLPKIWSERKVLPDAFCSTLLRNVDEASSSATSAAAEKAQEDAAVAHVMSLPPQQAFADAARRADVSLQAVTAADEVDPVALKRELAHLEAALAASKDGGVSLPNSAATNSLEAAESLLRQAQEAERLLRVSNSTLQLNAARRNGFIGKLTECLSVAAERSSVLQSEIDKYQAVQHQIQGLQDTQAANPQATLYKPGKAAVSPSLFSSLASPAGLEAGFDADNDDAEAGFDAFWPSGAAAGSSSTSNTDGQVKAAANALQHDADIGAKLLNAYADDDGTGTGVAAVVAEADKEADEQAAPAAKRRKLDHSEATSEAGKGAGAAATGRKGKKDKKSEKKEGAPAKAKGGGDGIMFSVDDLAADSSSSSSSSDSDSEGDGSSSGSSSDSEEVGQGKRGGSNNNILSGAAGTSRQSSATAAAAAADLDIQALIGPGKRYDPLLGAWVDEKDENVGHGGAGGLSSRDEDAWRR